jgi:hypothetical protein
MYHVNVTASLVAVIELKNYNINSQLRNFLSVTQLQDLNALLHIGHLDP